MTLRLILVDDHPVVRAGLRDMLSTESDITVVGECASGEEAVRLVAELRPDVVLMDLRMPGTDGVAATCQITEQGATRVLILTTFDSDGDILRAIEAGAIGYLLKDAPRPQLVDAVRAAARGETVLASVVAAKLVTRLRGPAPQDLTRREIEVLRCVARGLSNPDIARSLHIGEATVKTHLLRTFEKLGVGNRTAAVLSAITRGILPTPG